MSYSKPIKSTSTELNIDFSPKKAYPNNETYIHIPGQHDVQKWLQAVREIYQSEQSGGNRLNSIKKITSGWSAEETHDFLNWIKFYEAGDHMKYKFAAWYENPDITNYSLYIKKDPEPTPAPAQDFNYVKEKEQKDSERRQIIEKQRGKIISRLDSAEKLLRSPDGHAFSGKEFESLLESIYELKKKIQMVNKISTSTRLYDDMIVRQANILNSKGFKKASNVLYSLADDSAAIPEVTPPPDPGGGGQPGAPGGLPSMGPGMPQGAVGETPNENIPDPDKINSPGLISFLNRLNGDNSLSEDDLENDDDTLEVSDADDLLVSEAQQAPIEEPITTSPAPAPLKPAPVPPPAKEAPLEVEEKPLEVKEDDIEGESKNLPKSNFNVRMDQVLSDVSVSDVVSELEDLDKIFKTREIPRRLGKVDMMLDSLGLASFFPTLSEATNKSLEANNYIATRIEDILSKLRGTLATSDIDLKGEDNVEKPEVAGIKNKLQQDQDKEKARKKMRKEQEAAELEGKSQETPEVEIEEDLTAPIPAPAAPPPAPKAPAV